MGTRLTWWQKFSSRYYQVSHSLGSFKRTTYRFFVAKPRQVTMWVERWWAKQERNYNERRVIERQLKEMIKDTEHFNDRMVFRYFVDYVQRFDKRSFSAQTIIALFRKCRPNVAGEITE